MTTIDYDYAILWC